MVGVDGYLSVRSWTQHVSAKPSAQHNIKLQYNNKQSPDHFVWLVSVRIPFLGLRGVIFPRPDSHFPPVSPNDNSFDKEADWVKSDLPLDTPCVVRPSPNSFPTFTPTCLAVRRTCRVRVHADHLLLHQVASTFLVGTPAKLQKNCLIIKKAIF